MEKEGGRHIHHNTVLRPKAGDVSRMLNNSAFTRNGIVIMTTNLVFGFIISGWVCANSFDFALSLFSQEHVNYQGMQVVPLKIAGFAGVCVCVRITFRGPHHNDFDCSISGVCGPAASASPGNMFEVWILRLHSRLTESKLWEWGPEASGSSSPMGDSNACSSLKPLLCSIVHNVHNS